MRHVLVKKGGETIPVQVGDGEEAEARIADLRAKFGDSVTEADGSPIAPPAPAAKPKAKKRKAKAKKRK